jgi:hypothetical protein
MPTVNRTLHIRTPAILTDGATVMYFEDALKVDIKANTFNIPSAHADLPRRNQSLEITITGKPHGVYAYKTALFPATHLNPVKGDPLFTGTDNQVVIQEMRSSSANKYTFKNARITKMPTLMFAGNKTLWGPVTYRAMFANSTDPTVLNNWYEIASNAFSDTSFDPADVLTQIYTALWNSLNFAENVEGIAITPDCGLAEEAIPNYGVVNMRFDGKATVQIKVRPKVLTSANIRTSLDQAGTGFVVGAARQANAHNFVLAGTGVDVSVIKAHLDEGGYEFHGDSDLISALTFNADRAFTSGAAGAILSFGATVEVLTMALTSGTINVALEQTLSAGGGTAPYTWAVAAGALPTGLSVSSGGVLSGTPSQSGTFLVRIKATDNNAVIGYRDFVLTIAAA